MFHLLVLINDLFVDLFVGGSIDDLFVVGSIDDLFVGGSIDGSQGLTHTRQEVGLRKEVRN